MMPDDKMTDSSSSETLPMTTSRPEQPRMDDAAGGSTADDADESLPGDETVGDPDASDQEMDDDEQGDAIENIDPDDLSVQRAE